MVRQWWILWKRSFPFLPVILTTLTVQLMFFLLLPQLMLLCSSASKEYTLRTGNKFQMDTIFIKYENSIMFKQIIWAYCKLSETSFESFYLLTVEQRTRFECVIILNELLFYRVIEWDNSSWNRPLHWLLAWTGNKWYKILKLGIIY